MWISRIISEKGIKEEKRGKKLKREIMLIKALGLGDQVLIFILMEFFQFSKKKLKSKELQNSPCQSLQSEKLQQSLHVQLNSIYERCAQSQKVRKIGWRYTIRIR